MRRLACAAAVLALMVPAAARADVFAAVEVPGAGTNDTDIGIFDAATGVRSPLPAAVDTSDAEWHPSFTSDGTRMVFHRDSAGGTRRTIVYDFRTGAQADLFDVFTDQSLKPQTPNILPDGSAVIVSAAFAQNSQNAVREARLERVSLANFPTGPFPLTQIDQAAFPNDGTTLNGFMNGSEPISTLRPADGQNTSDLLVGSRRVHEIGAFLGASTTNGQVLVFTRRVSNSGPADLVYRPLDTVATATDARLPQLINTTSDESEPKFSPDGRFLAFARRTPSSDRLFVFDTQTQTMLNPAGIDIGNLPSIFDAVMSDAGAISIWSKSILADALVTPRTVTVSPTLSSGIGILVQRIVGHHRLLGRTVPTLKTIGRVPLGRGVKGRRFRARWDDRVNGRRLRPGRYLVTIRAVTPKGVVRELGKSFRLRIR